MTNHLPPPCSSIAEPLSASHLTIKRGLGLYRLLRVRLRFVAVLVALAVAVGQWDTISTHVNRWIDRWTGTSTQLVVSPDTEYFCPMCPGVLSSWPDTCPVCNMPLVRRKKGEAVLLPSGVVARMQLSPQRIQLAGLETSPVEYRELTYDVRLIGRVRDALSAASSTMESARDRLGTSTDRWIDCVVRASDMPFLQAAQRLDALVERAAQVVPCPVRLIAVEPSNDASGSMRARFVVESAPPPLEPGSLVPVRVRADASKLEPFSSQPRGIPPLRAGEPRSVCLCVEHPEEIHLRSGKCPHDGNTLEVVALADHQRIRWRCPLHPNTVLDEADQHCPQCPDQSLVGCLVTFAPEGQVLAVPESAVIDTGRETVVYVESMPGMFDGVRIRLGTRAGAYYPVIDGLARGQRVVSRGAFLVDAETKLNPSVASAYFGAAGASASAPSPSTVGGVPPADSVGREEVRRLLARFDMPAADRELAERQRVCPVTGMLLGSMGKPPKKTVGGETVFLCCAGCERSLLRMSAPAKTGKEASPP